MVQGQGEAVRQIKKPMYEYIGFSHLFAHLIR